MPRLLCIGDLNADITITLRHPLAEGSDTDGAVAISGGGSAANVAAWAIGEGIESRFVGPLGDDDMGDYLAREMRDRGVDLRDVRRVGGTTRSVAAIVATDGNRSLVSDQNNLIALEGHDLNPSWFDDVDWLHLTAYTYIALKSRAIFSDIIDHATTRSVPVSIDPSAAELLRSNCDHSEVVDAMSGVDLLTPSHDEAEYLTGIEDPETAAAALLELATTVAVTCGADGAWIATRGSMPFHVDAESVDIVNTLGCGDAFAAGLISGLLINEPLLTAVQRAIAAGTKAALIPTAR